MPHLRIAHKMLAASRLLWRAGSLRSVTESERGQGCSADPFYGRAMCSPALGSFRRAQICVREAQDSVKNSLDFVKRTQNLGRKTQDLISMDQDFVKKIQDLLRKTRICSQRLVIQSQRLRNQSPRISIQPAGPRIDQGSLRTLSERLGIECMSLV